MRCNKNTSLSVRASYNCIDLTGYFHYPADMVEKILIAMEEGCTRHQIDMALHKNGHKEIMNELINIQTVPDVDSFVKKLSGSIKKSSGMDIRENIKLLELILPKDKPHGWSTQNSHITLHTIEKYMREEEPEITIQFLHFLAADCLIAGKITDYRTELRCMVNSFFTGSSLENEKLYLPNFRQMELIALYYAVSGMEAEEALSICGKTAAALGFLPRQTYHVMLETATLFLMYQEGITSGCAFFEKNKLPVKYEIMRIGLWKKLHAILCQEDPLLLEECIAICRRAGKLSEALFSGSHEHTTILACQLFTEAVSRTAGIWSDITVPKDMQQYLNELLSYCRKEAVKNVWNHK